MGEAVLRVAIVEDDRMYTEQLSEYLKHYQQEKQILINSSNYQDGDGFVVDYRAQFDIILMDIQMKFLDGISAAKEIRKMDSEVVIIFITNMDQYAIKGYEVDALDYVLKPVNYFIFREKLDRAVLRIQNRQESYILLDVKGGVKKQEINQICYIESQGHTIIYHTVMGLHEGRSTLKELEKQLQEHHFIRCNKGLLVNLKYVDGVRNGYAEVNGENLAIGRTRKSEFMAALTNYISKVVK